jgi:hypothetical protein
MGTIRTGANGGFSGKAGSVIGSRWRDVSYIRGLSKLSNKPASEKQLMQRARFTTAVAFLQPIKKLLELGFKTRKAGLSTGYNTAMQELLRDAIIGDYPDFGVDFSKVKVSRGGHGKAIDVQLQAASYKMTVSWMPNAGSDSEFADDPAVLVLYNVTKKAFIRTYGETVRSDGQQAIAMPGGFIGDTFHAWIFFTSRDGKSVSESVYAGQAGAA